jgi:photosystem II stability/assembly factor-like uncharacterized protein
VVCALVAWSAGSTPADSPRSKHTPPDAILPVEVDSGTVTILSRYTDSDGNRWAAEHLADLFESFGYTVEIHYFHTVASLKSIAFASSGVGIAVGGDGMILRSVEGEVWIPVSEGLESVDSGLHDIDPVAGSDWVVVGNLGVIATSDDSGVSWTIRSNPASKRLNGVDILSGGVGWVVGKEGVILRTTDGGASWNAQASGTLSFLYDVAALDEQTAVAVGETGLILRTSDGGATWAPVASGAAQTFARVEFVGTAGWAVGAEGTIRATADGGVTWTAEPSGTTESLRGVSFATAAEGWIVGDYSTILATTDGGETWTPQDPPAGGTTVHGVRSRSPSEVWAVGVAGFFARTSDGGASWEHRRDTVLAGWQNVTAVRPGTRNPGEEVLLVGHYDSYANIPHPELLAPGAEDNGSGIGVIVETARRMADVPHERTIRFVCFTAEEQGLFGSEAYAARAEERGDSIVAVFNLDCVGWNDNEMRIASNDDSAWLGDLAASLAATYAPGLPVAHLHCPSCRWSDHSSFWDHGFEAICGIESWNPFPPQIHTVGDTLGLLDMALLANVTRIALPTISTLARPDTTEATSIARGPALATGGGLHLEAPRPNPFLPSTRIRFRLEEKAEVRLNVYSAAGRRVRTLLDGSLDPGSHEVRWRGRDDFGRPAAAGVYFFRLEADGRHAVRKSIRLR